MGQLMDQWIPHARVHVAIQRSVSESLGLGARVNHWDWVPEGALGRLTVCVNASCRFGCVDLTSVASEV